MGPQVLRMLDVPDCRPREAEPVVLPDHDIISDSEPSGSEPEMPPETEETHGVVDAVLAHLNGPREWFGFLDIGPGGVFGV